MPSTKFRLPLLLCLALAAGLAGANALPPVTAFGTTPTVSNVSLSPNSKLLASAYSGQQVTLALLDLQSRKLRHSVKFDQTLKLRDLEFADDDTLIAVFSTTLPDPDNKKEKIEFPATFVIDARDGSSRMLLSSDVNRRIVPGSQRIVAYRTATPGEMLISVSLTERGPGVQRASSIAGVEGVLLSADVRTGKSRVVMKAGPRTVGWFVDGDGRVRGRVDRDRDDDIWTLFARRGESWEEIGQRKGRQFRAIGYDSVRDAIIAVDAEGEQRAKAWMFPLDGRPASVLYEDPNYDVEGAIFEPRTRMLLGLQIGGLEQRFHWFDDGARARQQWVAAAFPGERLSIDRYIGQGVSLVSVFGAGKPGRYYLVDFASGRAELAGQQYPQLAKVPLGEVRLITYPARDNYPIPAYLTLPPGREAKNLPFVVLPHGGPEARDGLGFDWWAQFLANRGYAVLQPQFRGSTGFGEAHRQAGYRQWGRRMQDDVSDGVKAMIAQGIADPKRVCIVGASYGGYAALAGATLTPELYACSVSVAGVSDLPAMINWVAERSDLYSDAVKYWNRHIGNPNDKAVEEVSPVNKVASVRAPIMLMHGIDDTVVPFEQSVLMEKALQKVGKPYELVRLDGEDHWLSRSETRTKMLEELERFLAKHIGQPAG